MAQRSVPIHRLFKALIGLSAPPVAVLAILTVTDNLHPGHAALAAGFCVAALALLARRFLGDVQAISGYAEEMIDNPRAVVPKLKHPELLPDLPDTINRLRESWGELSASMQRRTESTETILQNLPDPLILLDDERRVVRATVGARTLLGGEGVGGDLATLIRDPDVLDAADSVIRTGESETVEFLIQFPVEQAFAARLVRLPQPAVDGTSIVVALYDLTAIKRAEQTRVDFVANASHELRTPLSVLMGCIKTLRGPAANDTEAQSRFLAMMDNQADRMSQLVEDLLSLSRIELNEHTAPSGTVNLAALLEHVTDSLEFPASERSIKIDIDRSKDAIPVLGDDHELSQLFRNLVDNAIKYGREQTTVTVRLAPWTGERPIVVPRDRAITAVEIRDQGEGIAADHLPRLTERFYRVDTARSRELGGTGLGLAIVKHIVSRHRGALQIDSVVGEGSTFRVLLPAASPEELELPPDTPARAAE